MENEDADNNMDENMENEDENCSTEPPAPDNLISTPDKNKLLGKWKKFQVLWSINHIESLLSVVISALFYRKQYRCIHFVRSINFRVAWFNIKDFYCKNYQLYLS